MRARRRQHAGLGGGGSSDGRRRQAGNGRLLARAQHTKLSDRLTTDWDSQATVLDEEPEERDTEGDTDDK